MARKRKKVRKFIYPGLGFPIVLRNIEMVLTLGGWAPDVRLLQLSELAFSRLATKPAPLTGDEIHFVRHRMGLKVEAFADLLRVTHPTVLHWEKSRDRATKMNWGTEQDIRLKIAERSGVTGARFFDVYSEIAALELEPTENVTMVYDPSDPAYAKTGFEVSGRRRAPQLRNT
jgi:hypothetical protein